MSGKGSRERRKNAVNKAREAVYAARGDADAITNPFNDERRSRIFNNYVDQWLSIYKRHEDFNKEMELAYNYKPQERICKQ